MGEQITRKLLERNPTYKSRLRHQTLHNNEREIGESGIGEWKNEERGRERKVEKVLRRESCADVGGVY